MSNESGWYYAKGRDPVGPMTLGELIRVLPTVGGLDAMVYGPNMIDWITALYVASIVGGLGGAGRVPPPAPRTRVADEIDYEIFGDEGIFLAALIGPGTVWLQSLPFSRLAGRIAGTFARGKGEGSILGGLGNIFEAK